MALRVFLDANILLDFTLKKADYETAKKTITLAVNNRSFGITDKNLF